MPNLDSRPPEFERVDDVTFHLAARWVDNMFKDILEGKGKDDPFDLLANRWRWNLYLVEPKMLRQNDIQGTLETIAKKSYEKFVREPFQPPEPPLPEPKLEIPVEIIPPPWQLETLKQQSLIPTY
jgi:hypothetical protein